MFDTVQTSSKFVLEIMTLGLSANIMGSDKVFIVEGRSFMYIMESMGPRIVPWGTPHFIVPQFEMKVLLLGEFILTFFFLHPLHRI
jgi:hypothetical protein